MYPGELSMLLYETRVPQAEGMPDSQGRISHLWVRRGQNSPSSRANDCPSPSGTSPQC